MKWWWWDRWVRTLHHWCTNFATNRATFQVLSYPPFKPHSFTYCSKMWQNILGNCMTKRSKIGEATVREKKGTPNKILTNLVTCPTNRSCVHSKWKKNINVCWEKKLFFNILLFSSFIRNLCLYSKKKGTNRNRKKKFVRRGESNVCCLT